MAVIPICVKTPKGIEEIEKRTYRLPVRTRQVLIMIDGKRDYAALVAMFPGDTLPGACRQLIDDGFIVPLHKPESPPLRTAGSSLPGAGSGALLSAIDLQRLSMARDFMASTLASFVGTSASPLVSRIEAAARLPDLHVLAVPWREAMARSPEGLKQLAGFENRLAVIDQNFVSALASPRPVPTGAPLPTPMNDDERLEMARNFMVNTLSAFVGIAASSLIAHVEDCSSIEDLRHLFIDWRDAISLSRDGRKRLGELDAKLAALVS